MFRACCLLLIPLALATSARGQTPSELAIAAQTVFAKHCLKCHANAESDYIDVRSLASLKSKSKDNDRPYITPGKLDESLLWDYVKDRASSMPKYGDERRTFTDAQREILKKWILAGAPDFPTEPARKFVSLETMLAGIFTHAINADPRDVVNLRYFTLTHLHNNNLHVPASNLRLTRAALAKALNSLSWEQGIVKVEEVADTEGTVLVVNIAKLGWKPEVWNAIAQAYPYNLGYAEHNNEKLKTIDDKLRKQFNNRLDLIHVRADWFVATATRPPLYHQILFESKLPDLIGRAADPRKPDNPKNMTVIDLENYLGVKVVANLLAKEPQVMRAGFPASGVSGQNRLIERHPLVGQGAYWKSYDFKASTRQANLQQFPLGPEFAGNPFNKLAFKHDGGEMIFHLPNGLQGYLLVDGKDNRIDAGPIEVVNDPANISGTPVVVNGISCIGCHKNGMRPSPQDQVRAGKGVPNVARERVKSLYPEKDDLDAAISRDQKIFLAALELTVGKFLRVDAASRATAITEFAEPVSEVAKRYYAMKDDLDATTVACELHLEKPQQVIDRADSSDVWKELGLGILAVERGRIKRAAWESLLGTSQMQQAAREFGYSPR